MNTKIIKTHLVVGKLILNTILAVASAVILPQIFHTVGILLGIGPMLGQMFLPMYIPVIIVGFFAGPWVGVTAGALSAVVSFMITGMPAMTLLPYMIIELAFFGYFAGVFCKTSWNNVLKVLATQVCARTVRIIVVTVVSLIFTNYAGITTTLDSFLIGLPGIVLQLILVPILYHFVKRRLVKRDA